MQGACATDSAALQPRAQSTAVARVFAGRVEVLSASLAKTLETELQDGDTLTLGKYGRFLQPFVAILE
jgi:hypothetical protein